MSKNFEFGKTYYIGDREVKYVGDVSLVLYFQYQDNGLYAYLVQAEAEEAVSDDPKIADRLAVDADHSQPTGVTRPLGVAGLVGTDEPAPTPSKSATSPVPPLKGSVAKESK